MSSATPGRIRAYLSEYSAKYPNAWKQFEAFRALRGKGLPNWPDWCWCPLSGAYAIVSGGGDNQVSVDRLCDVGILGALAAWRMTQGIYRVDPDVFEALWTTPLEKMPVDAFYYLPEWCVYIEAPFQLVNYAFISAPLLGWFAHLEWDDETRRPELRLVLDTGELFPTALHLTSDTLSDCIQAAVDQGAANVAAMIGGPAVYLEDGVIEGIRDLLAPLISVTLYICSEAADITDLRGQRDKPANPAVVKTKRGWRTFPASTPTVWLTGYRIGASLRLAAERRESTPRGGGTHASPRPHIRRAHWHSFWTGPRDGERRLIVRWLPPIAVGKGELVPTIHRVK